MTAEELLTEAERLARPCVHLRPNGSPGRYAAVWGGAGAATSLGNEFLHWLTVDCAFFPAGLTPRTGCLGVYTSETTRGRASGMVVHEPAARLSNGVGETRLYAEDARSLPPTDALFRFRSAALHEWLRENGWEPDWGYNVNFADKAPVHAYERRYQSQYPLYSGGVFATLGGWHFPWPDGDWEELLAGQLLIQTFENSEPWVEVWQWGNGYRVIERIT
jgi:hypothetical protein